MASDTTGNLLNTIRDRLLAFVDDAGRQLNDYVGAGSSARIYHGQAPDTVTYPYQVIRVIDGETDPELNNLRREFDVEVTSYGRPRSSAAEIELLADLAEGALLTWRESSAALGLSYGMTTKRRESLEPEPEAEVRDLVAVQVTVTCASWQKALTNALT